MNYLYYFILGAISLIGVFMVGVFFGFLVHSALSL